MTNVIKLEREKISYKFNLIDPSIPEPFVHIICLKISAKNNTGKHEAQQS